MVLEAVILRADEQQSGAVHIFQAFDRRVAAELDRRIVAGLGVRRRGQFGGTDRRHHRRRRIGVARIRLLQAGVADPLGLHHLAQVVAEFVGIDMLEFIGLGDDPRVCVVADEMDHLGVLLDRDQQLGFNPGAVVAAGVVEIGIARNAGNFGGGAERGGRHRCV